MAKRPNGTICDDSEAFDARGVLRDGYSIPFRINLMDGRPDPAAIFHDAKAPDPPATIDEALKAEFVRMAENQGFKTTAEMLASMNQATIEKTAAEVATKFMSAVAGAGVAKFVGDAASLKVSAITAAYGLRADAARAIAEHKVSTAYLGDQAPSFADAQRKLQGDPKDLMDAACATAAARLNSWR